MQITASRHICECAFSFTRAAPHRVCKAATNRRTPRAAQPLGHHIERQSRPPRAARPRVYHIERHSREPGAGTNLCLCGSLFELSAKGPPVRPRAAMQHTATSQPPSCRSGCASMLHVRLGPGRSALRAATWGSQAACIQHRTSWPFPDRARLFATRTRTGLGYCDCLQSRSAFCKINGNNIFRDI